MAKRLNLAAIAVAETLVGVMEHGGNNQGKTVERIIREAGGNPNAAPPWCGYFVAYCYKKAGSKAVTYLWGATRFLGRITGMGRVLKPRRGDIVVFNFPGGHHDSDHTGLLVTVCNADGKPVAWRKHTHVRCIEGNTGATGAVSDSTTGGDGVYVKVRPRGLVNRYVRVYR